MSEASIAKRGPRSDALRNRAEIVRVARSHFRERGTGASLDAIAREAGVGPGTLYRHFATRDDLIAAVLDVRDEELAMKLEEVDGMADPAEALRVWQRALEQYFSSYQGLAGPFGQALDTGVSPIAVACQWMISTSDRLLEAAQSAGAVRPDLRGEDVYLAALSVSWTSQIAATDPDAVEALRRIIDRGVGVAGGRD